MSDSCFCLFPQNKCFYTATASHPSSGYASVGALAPTRTDFAVMQWCTRTVLILLWSGIITISWSRLNLIGRSVALPASNEKPLYQGQTLSVICMGLAWLWFQHCPSCLHVLATQASDLCRGLGGLGRTVCLKHTRTKSDIGSAGVTLSLLSPGAISLD